MTMKFAVIKLAAALGVVAALALTATAAPLWSSHRVVTADVAELETNGQVGEPVEADPTDDGSIIVECVSLAAAMNARALPGGTSMGAASIPQSPLGPLKCWPNDGRHIR